MKSFFVTTTRATSKQVRTAILEADPDASLQYRRENRTLLFVLSARLSESALKAIPGVAQAFMVKPPHRFSDVL